MNIDAALATITGIDGTGLDLGERPAVAPDFPIGEYRRRYARLAALMDSQGFDALVLTQEEPVRYLSGYNSVIWAVGRWLPTIFVAARDPRQAALFCSSFDAGCAAGTSWATVGTYRSPEELPARVHEHLASIGAAPGRVGFEYGPGSFMALPQHLVSSLLGGSGRPAGSPPRDAGRLISALRMLKSPLEIERIRRSVGAAVAGYRPAWRRPPRA